MKAALAIGDSVLVEWTTAGGKEKRVVGRVTGFKADRVRVRYVQNSSRVRVLNVRVVDMWRPRDQVRPCIECDDDQTVMRRVMGAVRP